MSKYPMVDLKKVKTFSIQERPSKVRVEDFAQVYQKGATFESFLLSAKYFESIRF
jgi:hypothetical protein